MSQRHGILCAGCWTLDQIRIIDHWPNEESLALTLSTDKQGGGSAHNVSIDLKKMDASLPVFTAGLLGDDAAGDFLIDQATQCGVDTTQLQRVTGATTSFTDVMSVESTGKRTFFHHTGANDLITPDHISFSECSAKILHLGLLGVHKTLDEPWMQEANGWVEILKRAQSAGIHTNIEMVSIDPQINRRLALPCLDHLNSLIVNDYEAGCLSNINTIENGRADAEACMAAARHLLNSGAMEFVVVHFPAGAAAVSKSGDRCHVPSIDVDPKDIKGSVGAGDAFAAGVLYGVHDKRPLDQCVLLGHAIAAASLRSPTTVGSVKSIDDCLKLAQVELDYLYTTVSLYTTSARVYNKCPCIQRVCESIQLAVP